MDKFLAKLERRAGKLSIEHLTWVLVGGTAAVFVLAKLFPDRNVLDLLVLDMSRVVQGQVWRLVTFVFIPPPTSLIWFLFDLYWLWMLGSNLENAWGAFKFNVYYGMGILGTVLAALLLHFAYGGGAIVGGLWLNTSLVFAFATLFPDFQIVLFFILPVRMKWLGLATAAFLGYEAITGSWADRAAIVIAVANYFLFFGAHLVAMYRGRAVVVRQAARRAAMRSDAPGPSDVPVLGQRVCAICGKREADGADIRVCSCEKCGGTSRNLCLEHARNH